MAMMSRIYVKPKVKTQKGALILSSYLISHELPRAKLNLIAEALTNTAIEEYSLNKFPVTSGFSYAVEVGYLPGVTDNAAHTARETILDLLHLSENAKLAVYTSKIFLVKKGGLQEVKEFASSLYNPLIERVYIANEAELMKKGLPLKEPKVVLKKTKAVIKVPLIHASDQELAAIGKEGIMDPGGARRGPLALDLASMRVIREHFRKLGREPSDIELESLAQTWSEHCKHTIFRNPIDTVTDGLYRTYIKGATNLIRKKKGKKDFCVSVFSDNSGGIAFDNNFLITHKVETHNSPSALDPYGGAITGIVGVNRDTVGFGLGAKPVANVYGFCLGYPEDKTKYYRDPELTEEMLPSRRIMEGVIKGVNVGGNCSGIPTLSGFLKFDDRYRGKPLVFAGTVGLIPRKSGGRLSHLKKARTGDYIVMLGGRVGLDGIHGATFSSVALDSASPAAAVQIGDPVTQKKLSDAIVKEARDLALYDSITDNGAGGLSCSVSEMAKESGGAEVNLEKVPLKYPGLRPWEIWISESQERMTLAVPKKNWPGLKKLMVSRGVEATVIGKFTDSGKCKVKFLGKTIMDIDMDFLHEGLPLERLETREVYVKHNEPEKIPTSASLTQDLEKLLATKNIGSFAFVSEQYDHEVQASSVLKPLSGPGRVNTDAQVFSPVLESQKAAVLTSSTYPSYGDISTYHMAGAAIDTAIRNAVAAGGSLEHLALLDNFCWCSSNDPVRLGQLVDAVKACYDYAIDYGTPFISGKDSMWNDFKGYNALGNPVKISIPPTLLISAIGIMDNYEQAVSPEFKNAGDTIYLLGETHDELGGGEYYRMHGFTGANVPKVNSEKNIRTYRALEQAVKKGIVKSSISVTSGGLAVALAKASLGGLLGCQISLKNIPGRAETPIAKLFSESQGRVIVSVNPKNASAFEKLIKNIPHARLGKVANDGKFVISDGKRVIETRVKKLHGIYHKFSNSMK
jgi:phosphoribosylformylglycinamidine synthase